MSERYLVRIDMNWLRTNLTMEHPDAKDVTEAEAKEALKKHGFAEHLDGWIGDEHALATLKGNELISSKPI